jgi:uncharacterized protein GlcG (DUF336 family)
LLEIIANLKERIQEAKLNGWLGEVAGLDASLRAAAGHCLGAVGVSGVQPAQDVRVTRAGIAALGL